MIAKRQRTKEAPFLTWKVMPSPWQTPFKALEFHEDYEKSIGWFKQNEAVRGKGDYDYDYELNDALPVVLFESSDPLILVNMAGADGWEITGALGSDMVGVQHRMMRREI